MKRNILILVLTAALGVFATIGLADTAETQKATPATQWHGLPNNNPGHDGVTGQPNGGNPGNSNGIHNVGPGEAAAYAKSVDGDPPSCQFHGGFQGVKKNC